MTNETNTNDSLFGEVIHTYTRAQALDDGMQIDANIGDLESVSRQHFKMPCYMTAGLFGIMENAVANERYGQDFAGIWHDICFMGSLAIRAGRGGSSASFKVIIKGAGRKSLYTVLVECGPVDVDDLRPCLTFMLPEER